MVSVLPRWTSITLSFGGCAAAILSMSLAALALARPDNRRKIA
jgi:hypothetical protein